MPKRGSDRLARVMKRLDHERPDLTFGESLYLNEGRVSHYYRRLIPGPQGLTPAETRLKEISAGLGPFFRGRFAKTDSETGTWSIDAFVKAALLEYVAEDEGFLSDVALEPAPAHFESWPCVERVPLVHPLGHAELEAHRPGTILLRVRAVSSILVSDEEGEREVTGGILPRAALAEVQTEKRRQARRFKQLATTEQPSGLETVVLPWVAPTPSVTIAAICARELIDSYSTEYLMGARCMELVGTFERRGDAVVFLTPLWLRIVP